MAKLPTKRTARLFPFGGAGCFFCLSFFSVFHLDICLSCPAAKPIPVVYFCPRMAISRQGSAIVVVGFNVVVGAIIDFSHFGARSYVMPSFATKTTVYIANTIFYSVHFVTHTVVILLFLIVPPRPSTGVGSPSTMALTR